MRRRYEALGCRRGADRVCASTRKPCSARQHLGRAGQNLPLPRLPDPSQPARPDPGRGSNGADAARATSASPSRAASSSSYRSARTARSQSQLPSTALPPRARSPETIVPRGFSWSARQARATTQQTFLAVKSIDVEGPTVNDQVRVSTADYTQACSLFLCPLGRCARLGNGPRAGRRHLAAALPGSFWHSPLPARPALAGRTARSAYRPHQCPAALEPFDRRGLAALWFPRPGRRSRHAPDGFGRGLAQTHHGFPPVLPGRTVRRWASSAICTG